MSQPMHVTQPPTAPAWPLSQILSLCAAKRLATVLLLGIAYTLGSAEAQPVTDRILAGYQVRVEKTCWLFKINFNHRIRYVSHFPTNSGTELRILLRPIDPRRLDLDDGLGREALRPPQGRPGITAIRYEEAIAEGPTLSISFDRPVNFDAAGGADFQSVVFSVTDSKNGKACRPVFPGRAADGWESVISPRQAIDETVVRKQPQKSAAIPPAPAAVAVPAAPDPAVGKGHASVSGPTAVAGTGNKSESGPAASEAAMAALMAKARSALIQRNFGLAIAELKKATRLPENTRTPEALELLGVAYLKDRQLAAAKAIFEDYLRHYPSGEGSDGVRQRLQAMETAGAPSPKTLHAATIGPAAIDGAPYVQGGPQQGAGGSYWSVSGSVSSFYIGNDTRTVMRDPTLALDFNASKDDYRVHLNAFLTSIDVSAVWGNPDMKSRFRFSGTEDNRFGADERNIAGVSALYLDTSIKSWSTSVRLGRQTRNAGGILGRFDGAVVSYQANPLLGISVVAGSPVEFRSDAPFKDDRYFYGGSLNFGPYHGWDASLYAIEQMDRSVIDRQAVGTELRYSDGNKSAFLNIDYDTYFNALDAAIFTGTWTLPDKSVIRVGADYRRAPFLTTWNAIRGQPFGTLYDLLKAYTLADVQQMAMDRTATYQSSTVGYSFPLSDKLQLNLDFTQAHIDGTIASYNVSGTPDTGNEFYYSAQLVGTSLFKADDLYTAALRLSDLQDSRNYALNVSTRYLFTNDLRVQPRFIGTFAEGKNSDYTEYTALPSLLLSYTLTKDLSFEVELGERWTWRTQGTTRTSENEFLVTAGFRLDFYADAQNCLTPSVFCRMSSQTKQ
jgi:hypothetical protein